MKADAREESLAIPIAMRAAIDARDNTTCRVCGKYLGNRRALHHIKYGGDARGVGGRRHHNIDEIATVCWIPGDPMPGMASCHERVHSDKGYYQPLLLEVLTRPGVTVLQLVRWNKQARP